MPALPVYTGIEAQDRANIAWLQNPNFNTAEVDTAAAERALAAGVSGSQFGGFFQPRMRDDERIKRATLASQLLQPYQEREQQTRLEKMRQAAEDSRLATQGQQAMQRLQAEQAGALQRMTIEQRNLLARQAAEGEQAMERLRLTESGATERQQAGIEADLSRFESGQAADDRRLAAQLGARETEQTRDIESRAGLQESQEAAALQRQAQAGDQAMAQLRAEQEGRLELQSQAQRAQLQQLSEQGRLAILQMQARGYLEQAFAPQPAPQAMRSVQVGNPLTGTQTVQIPDRSAPPMTSTTRPNASTLQALNDILRQYSSAGAAGAPQGGREYARNLYRGR